METWSKYAKLYDPIKCASIDGTDCDPHDRAVVRALNATYKPNRFVKGRPECTIFVSRLNHETTKETIKEIFSKYGKLKRFRIIKDIVTGMSKGYAFVEYEEEQSAEEAYRLANKMLVDERHIFVDFECERLLKGWKPRRLGGGFGGKKESGQLRFGGRDRPFKKPIALELKEKKEKREREEEERRRRVKHKRRSPSKDKRKRDSSSKERKRPISPKEHSRSRDKTKHSSETKVSRKKSPANSRGDAPSRKSRTDDRRHSPPRQNNVRPPSPPQQNRKRHSPYRDQEKRRPPSPRPDNKPMYERSRRESPLGRKSSLGRISPLGRKSPMGRKSPLGRKSLLGRMSPLRRISPEIRSRSPISSPRTINHHENIYRGQYPRDQHQYRAPYNNGNSEYEPHRSYLPANGDFQHPPPSYNEPPPPRKYYGEPRREFARDVSQENYLPRDQYFPPEESNYSPIPRNFVPAPAPIRGRGRGRGRGGHIPYQRGGIRGGFQRYK